MDVRIDKAPGQTPRRRPTAAQTVPTAVSGTGPVSVSFQPPPVLIRIPDLEAMIPTAQPVAEPALSDEPAAELWTRIDTAQPFVSIAVPEADPVEKQTSEPLKTSAKNQSKQTAPSVSPPIAAHADEFSDHEDDLPPAPLMPKLPPVLQRAGSYRASPTVLLGVIVVVLCLAALPLLKDKSDSAQSEGDATLQATMQPAVEWPGVPNAAIAKAEEVAEEAAQAATSQTVVADASQSDATGQESPSETSIASVAEAEVEVSRWPREATSTPVAQFEGSIVRPTLKAQNERVGSSIH